VSPHKYVIGQNVCLSETSNLSENAKLAPKWLGPFKIFDINNNNAKLKLKIGMLKVVNVMSIKPYCEELSKNCLSQDKHCSFETAPRLSQDTPCSSQGIPRAPNRPITRALQKIIHYKNEASMAIDFIINEELEFDLPPDIINTCYILGHNYNKYHSQWCYSHFPNRYVTKSASEELSTSHYNHKFNYLAFNQIPETSNLHCNFANYVQAHLPFSRQAQTFGNAEEQFKDTKSFKLTPHRKLFLPSMKA
jgi:hypothetical protein